MTRAEKIAFAYAAEERIKGYMRESSRDPAIHAAMRRRIEPSHETIATPADEVVGRVGAALASYTPVRREVA